MIQDYKNFQETGVIESQRTPASVGLSAESSSDLDLSDDEEAFEEYKQKRLAMIHQEHKREYKKNVTVTETVIDLDRDTYIEHVDLPGNGKIFD